MLQNWKIHSSNLQFCVKNICEETIREAILETEMDQLETELFGSLNITGRRSVGTPPISIPSPLTPFILPMLSEKYTPPNPLKITLQTTPKPAKKKEKHQTLCQAICATTLEHFPSLIRNPQLLLSLTVQQTLSVQSLLESGELHPEEDIETTEEPENDIMVSPYSTMVCREQVGYDEPCGFGPWENYSDAQVHYDMIPRAEWNIMIPGLQARPCFLKRVKKVPKQSTQYKTRHEEVLARRPTESRDQKFVVTSSEETSPRRRLPSKPKKEVTTVKRCLFEELVIEIMQRLPSYTRSAVIKLIRDVREKKGGLSGQSHEDIIQSVLNFEMNQR